MQLKQKVTSKIKQIIKLPIWITIPVAFALLVFVLCFIAFFIEKPVKFSYSQKTCTSHLTLLPGISKVSGNISGFEVKNEDILSLGSVQFLSLKTCFSAKKAPTVGDTRISISPFGGWFARKTFRLSVPEPPLVRASALSGLIPTVKPLVMNLSGSDLVFEYQLEIENKLANCPMKDSAIHCDIASLRLTQDKNYDIKLIRLFEDQKVTTIFSKNIKTLNSTKVIDSSVSQGQVIYDNPKSFIFNFDKDILRSNITLEKIDADKRTVVATTLTLKQKQATVMIKDDLSRDSTYEFSINQLEAIDGSTLAESYVINFKMSDGPSVSSVNVGSNGLATSQTIVLTFDQTLADSQDITKFITTSGISTSISRLNNQVSIKYVGAPMCTDLNISVKSGLLGSNGVIQNDPWSFSTRTVCHSTSTIGYSRGGRPIIAYTFGNGGTTVLYIGSIHGNELSSKYLMDAWVNELEANARSIPSDKKIIIIPTVNPDGVAANMRNNSGNVDLNRNFPTNDWQTDVYTPSNQPFPGGGGSSPLSEPESQAIASYTLQLNPRLILSFHSRASYAIGNLAGDSSALAARYAQLSGYRDATGDNDAFTYPITGTYDTWVGEQHGIASLIIELSSSTSSEFSRNKAALWAMVRS